jgi:transcription antitermination factor NusG
MTMQCFPIGPAWYVLSAEPGADRIVWREGVDGAPGHWASRLVDDVAAMGFDVYQPRERAMKMRRRKRVEIVEPLLNGYVFVRFDEFHDDWQRLLDVRGVENVLSNCDRPSRVSNLTVETLRRAELAGAFDRRPDSSPFKIGELVRIAEGPFAGLQAHVQHLIAKLRSTTATKRVKVLMQFLGNATVIELPVASVEKV